MPYISIKMVVMPVSLFFPMVCCLYYPATTLGQAEVQLSHVFFEKDTEPYARQRDAEVLRMAEVPITSLLGEVSEVVFFSSILLAWIHGMSCRSMVCMSLLCDKNRDLVCGLDCFLDICNFSA